MTGRTPERVALVEAYAKAQGMWRTADTPDPGLHRHAGARSRRRAALARRPEAAAGPRHPRERQGRVRRARWRRSSARRANSAKRYKVEGTNFDLGHGDVVIAAITSCTNTSNPSVMIGAGLLARNAVAKGLQAPSRG